MSFGRCFANSPQNMQTHVNRGMEHLRKTDVRFLHRRSLLRLPCCCRHFGGIGKTTAKARASNGLLKCGLWPRLYTFPEKHANICQPRQRAPVQKRTPYFCNLAGAARTSVCGCIPDFNSGLQARSTACAAALTSIAGCVHKRKNSIRTLVRYLG